MKPQTIHKPLFIDSPVALAQADKYAEIYVDAAKVLKSWQTSLLAHELMGKDGAIKPDDNLTETRLERRMHIRAQLADGATLEKPVLGIGMFDNIEIGAGSDVLVTLALCGVASMPVHVRKSQIADFKSVIAN